MGRQSWWGDREVSYCFGFVSASPEAAPPSKKNGLEYPARRFTVHLLDVLWCLATLRAVFANRTPRSARELLQPFHAPPGTLAPKMKASPCGNNPALLSWTYGCVGAVLMPQVNVP
jgi:hypothetical protein